MQAFSDINFNSAVNQLLPALLNIEFRTIEAEKTKTP